METAKPSESLVETMKAGPITVVSVRASVLTDNRTITALVSEIRDLSRRNKSPNILLDFHRVEHLSFDLVGEMKVVTEDIERRGGTIRCCSLRKEMRALLGILGLNALYVGNSVRHAIVRYLICLEERSKSQANSGSPAETPCSERNGHHGK